MRRIVHLSDLHFGRVDRRRVDPLVMLVKDINPDLVIVSGDLTQRAKESEFLEAKAFMERLNKPLFVIPGNHDIPLWNVFKRLSAPFMSYSRHISDDLSPFYADDEVAIVGINTVRNTTISSGRINARQLDQAEERLKAASPGAFKLVVCHHPFDLPSANTHHKHTHKVVGRSNMAMKRLAAHGADLFLSGHLHVRHVGDTTTRYKVDGYSGLIVQAGTAISTRARGEPVSFNVLHLDRPHAVVDSYFGHKNEPGFSLLHTERYAHSDQTGWKRI
jgi:3',5'-cyclic AMP phosphodiesterase CpdA